MNAAETDGRPVCPHHGEGYLGAGFDEDGDYQVAHECCLVIYQLVMKDIIEAELIE